ncbi:tRNA 2-thiouridine(34) synthase MnmA [Candidatus Uhrbacteria bacterium]|nr:tRNA 2-thiouridine(34) synthase MnmA [Candidatus Uhrbacteria bacterium]
MRIVVGISGGVDSTLAAALLQERGYVVVGCYLKVAIPGAPCPWEDDLPMCHRVAAVLDIPLIVRDVSSEYERDVLAPMLAAYERGHTPNPDAVCNRWVKFDALRAVAEQVGADRIATGHYARLRRGHGGTGELLRGVDPGKDQSYFLWMLTEAQMAVTEFPLGERWKIDVRAEAHRRGLPNWDRSSTSGVCFLGALDLPTFLRNRIAPRPARVVTTTGDVIGDVPNALVYTAGQRVALGGQPTPRYVVQQRWATQELVVSASPEDALRYTQVIMTQEPHWIGVPPTLPLRAMVRIRHRQDPLRATVERRAHGLEIQCDTPLSGVAPGQAVVMDDGERVFGGAVIREGDSDARA